MDSVDGHSGRRLTIAIVALVAMLVGLVAAASRVSAQTATFPLDAFLNRPDEVESIEDPRLRELFEPVRTSLTERTTFSATPIDPAAPSRRVAPPTDLVSLTVTTVALPTAADGWQAFRDWEAEVDVSHVPDTAANGDFGSVVVWSARVDADITSPGFCGGRELDMLVVASTPGAAGSPPSEQFPGEFFTGSDREVGATRFECGLAVVMSTYDGTSTLPSLPDIAYFAAVDPSGESTTVVMVVPDSLVSADAESRFILFEAPSVEVFDVDNTRYLSAPDMAEPPIVPSERTATVAELDAAAAAFDSAGSAPPDAADSVEPAGDDGLPDTLGGEDSASPIVLVAAVAAVVVFAILGIAWLVGRRRSSHESGDIDASGPSPAITVPPNPAPSDPALSDLGTSSDSGTPSDPVPNQVVVPSRPPEPVVIDLRERVPEPDPTATIAGADVALWSALRTGFDSAAADHDDDWAAPTAAVWAAHPDEAPAPIGSFRTWPSPLGIEWMVLPTVDDVDHVVHRWGESRFPVPTGWSRDQPIDESAAGAADADAFGRPWDVFRLTERADGSSSVEFPAEWSPVDEETQYRSLSLLAKLRSAERGRMAVLSDLDLNTIDELATHRELLDRLARLPLAAVRRGPGVPEPVFTGTEAVVVRALVAQRPDVATEGSTDGIAPLPGSVVVDLPGGPSVRFAMTPPALGDGSALFGLPITGINDWYERPQLVEDGADVVATSLGVVSHDLDYTELLMVALPLVAARLMSHSDAVTAIARAVSDGLSTVVISGPLVAGRELLPDGLELMTSDGSILDAGSAAAERVGARGLGEGELALYSRTMKSESELEVLLSGIAPMLEKPGPQAIEVTGRGAVGVVGWIGAPPDTGSVASAPLPAPLASPHSGSPEVSRLRAALRQAVAAIRSGNDVSPETVRTLARTLEQCPGGYQWLASAVVIDGPAIGYVFPADARMWLHAIVATDGARDEIIERLGRDRLDTADTSSRVEQDEFPARVGDLSGDRLRSAADTMVAVIDDLADELGPPSSMPSGTDRSSGFQHRLPSLRAKLESVLDQDTAELGIEEARVLARVAIEYRRVALGMGLLAAPSPVAPQSR